LHHADDEDEAKRQFFLVGGHFETVGGRPCEPKS
jgi:hypothetical protein